MKAAVAAVAIVIVLLLGVALPRYLAPDDIAGCKGPGSGTCAPADAIVAISGGDTFARVGEAVALYKAGWAPRLIFSGAASDAASPSNASAMRTYAVADGVPESAITMDEKARSTSENAANVTALAWGAGEKRLIVVTSGYHQRRAGLEFARAMGTRGTVLNHPVHSDNQWSDWWWATPIGWWLSIGELLKIGAFYAGVK